MVLQKINNSPKKLFISCSICCGPWVKLHNCTKEQNTWASKIQVDQERLFIAMRKDNYYSFFNNRGIIVRGVPDLFTASNVVLAGNSKQEKKTSANMTFILHSLTCSTAWLKGVFISIHRLLLVRGGAALSLPYVLQLSHKSLAHKEKLLCVCEKDHIPLTYQMIWLARWQTFCTTFHTLCWYSRLEQPNRSVKINKYQSQCSR